MSNTAQEQQRLNAELALIEAQIDKESKQRKAIRQQLRSLDLTEGERNALEAQSQELENSIEGLYRSQTARSSELKVLTNDVPKSSNPPVAAFGNQPVPTSSNQNTGGNSSSSTATRYQQAVANDQVRLDGLNQRLVTTNQQIQSNQQREAELSQVLRNNPEGSPAYQAALDERRAVRRQNLELENQQILLRQDISVRENSLATNVNQLSLITTETQPPTIPPPPPTMVTDTTGTPTDTGAQLVPLGGTTIRTAPLDDPNAGEAEARAFLQRNQPVQSAQPDTGFTYYGAVPAAPVTNPQRTATVDPNPWAGIDPEKAAAWNQLSAADRRWLGNGDPTDPFILRRAPDGGRPVAAIDAVRDTAPAPLPDDNLAFEPPPDDNLAYTQGTNPGPGYTRSYDEFGNEITVRTPLPDDDLAYTQGVNDTTGYSFEDTGGVPTQRLSDFEVTDTTGYSFEDTGGVPTQRLSDFPVTDTTGYSFEDTGGVPTQRLSDFEVTDTTGYNTFEDTGGVPTQRLSDFTDPGPGYGVSDDGLAFSELPDDNLAYTQGVNPGPGYTTTYDEFGNEITLPSQLPDDNLAFTEGVNPGPGYGVSDDGLAFSDLPDDGLAFQDTEVEDTEGYIVPDGSINVPEGQQEFAPTALGGNFSAQYDVESGTYGVFDEDTGQFVQTGLTEQEATLLAQDASIGDPNFAGNPDAASDTGVPDEDAVPASEVAFAPTALGGDFVASFDPETGTWGVFDNDTGVFVETGLTEQEAILKAQEYSVGDPNFAGNADAATDPGLTPEQAQAQAQAQAEAAAAQAAIAQAAAARKAAQEAVAAQRKQADEGDWRVKLRLAGGADYLYRAPENQVETGILYPLYVSNGVVFPYTPTITTNYAATYNSYDLTHSNFRGQFYQNSFVDEVTIQAVFTAQDTTEANYMLAVIHFFRSVTKMFYGQDPNRGQPPPLVFLQGLGEFQFNLHPCVVRSFTYSMPNDVDYIRARTANFDGTSLLKRRDRQAQSLDSFSASTASKDAAGLTDGATSGRQQTVPTLGTKRPTYVPTRMETTITLLPIQTRQQVSQEFSLKRFASGELVRQGYW